MNRFTVVLSLLVSLASYQRGLSGILIVDSVGDRVMLASSFDGSIINQNFITMRSGGSFTPTNAIDSGRGSIFVSDQLADDVLEYSYSGALIGTVISGAQIDNPRGIAVRDNFLYITVEGGVNADTVQRLDLINGGLSTFISDSSLINPSFWDVAFRGSDVLVSEGSSGRIYQYDLNGNRIGASAFTNQTVTNPRQINFQSNGDVLLASAAAAGGIVRFDSSGAFQNSFGPPNAFGMFPLENGNYIYGASGNLSIFDPVANQVTPIFVNGTFGFRYMEFFDLSVIPEPNTIALILAAGLGLTCRRRRA